MQNFVFHNPTKIIFGKNTIPQIGKEATPYGKKALFIYGKNSIKSNGVYDKVVSSMKESGVTLVEHPGVKANPLVSHAREGVALGKKESVDFILAVGGGSVLDEAKAIAASIAEGVDVWDFYLRKVPVTRALPLVTVLTMAATGSEMNGGTVLTNEETHQKLGLAAAAMYPKVSILDPETLYTVPKEQFAVGAVDAVTHLLESYFTGSDPYTPLQDRYVEGVIRTIVEVAPRMIANPTDYEAVSTFMWAATMAWNGTAPAGVGSWGAPNHLIGHSMSSLYDTPHGASLSISLGGFLPYYSKTRGGRVEQMGKNIFGVDGDWQKAVVALRRWFTQIGSPTTLSQIGVDTTGFDKIVANIVLCAPLWGMPEYTTPIVTEILEHVR